LAELSRARPGVSATLTTTALIASAVARDQHLIADPEGPSSISRTGARHHLTTALVTRLATKRCPYNVKASRLKALFALPLSSLDDLKGGNQRTGLIVEGMPSGFDASDHPGFVLFGKRPQHFGKFVSCFLPRL